MRAMTRRLLVLAVLVAAGPTAFANDIALGRGGVLRCSTSPQCPLRTVACDTFCGAPRAGRCVNPGCQCRCLIPPLTNAARVR